MVRLRERETRINKTKPSIIPQGHYHPKINKISTEEGKITVFLEGQREISLSFDLIIKEWFCRSDIKPEQLKNYKI